MKKYLLIIILAMLVSAQTANAKIYEYGPGDYSGALVLNDDDILFMEGGTIGGLSVIENGIANIMNTDIQGGVAFATVGSYGKLNVTGGNLFEITCIHEGAVNITGGYITSLEVHNLGVASLYGGQIDTIASDQVLSEDGWIHIYAHNYSFDPDTNLLTGTWADNTDFTIQLLDIGTTPTYDLIRSHQLPEPATVILMAFGGLLIRKKYGK